MVFGGQHWIIVKGAPPAKSPGQRQKPSNEKSRMSKVEIATNNENNIA